MRRLSQFEEMSIPGRWAADLPETAVAEAGDVQLYVLHDVNELDLNPRAAGFDIVVSGHSHQPAQEERKGVLYINPGSAGPRRFRLPVTVARLDLNEKTVAGRIRPPGRKHESARLTF